MKRIKFLNSVVDNISLEEALEKVGQFVGNGKNGCCHSVFSLNANKVHLLNNGQIPYEVFDEASVVLPDGMSVVYGLQSFRHKIKKVTAGVDLMLVSLELANEKGYSVFFLGSPLSLLERVVKRCHEVYPNIRITGFQHGYYPPEQENEVVRKIATDAPDILYVAFGSPRKELFIHKYKRLLNTKVAIAIGGSYEVFVGDKKRGPTWRQKIGLEWAYRVIQDPKRLWKRYFITNSSFFYYLVRAHVFQLLKRQKDSQLMGRHHESYISKKSMQKNI